MTVEAVIFDIGNVLVEWHPDLAFDRAIGPERRKALFGAVDLEAMNTRIDLGEDIAQVVAETAAAHPAYANDIGLWHSRWADMFKPAIPYSGRLLRALRAKGVPVFALSNFGTETLALAEAIYPVLTAFDRRYISGHMGLMKPDPRIYQRVEADCGLKPAALLFADDRLENIQAAAARGWQTHHFTDPAGLAARLVAEGLLQPHEAAA